MDRRQSRWSWALVAGFCATVACTAEPGPSGSAATLCEALEGYVSACGSLSPCESAMVRDCDALEGALVDSYASAAVDCLNNLGTPMGCMQEAVAKTPSSSRLQAFATTVCLCSDGSGGGCEEAFLTGENSDVGRAGRLARVMNDELLDAVEEECLGGDGCTADFEDCATSVLSQFVPGDTSSCLADAVLGRASEDCDAAGTDGSAATSNSASGSGDPTGPDSSATSGDTTDPTDTGGETDGVCDREGCDCTFNEDCAGSLMCLDNTCTSTAECGDDPNEPNNGEIQAAFLAPITDADEDGSSISGELESPADIDWFRYEGSDEYDALVTPYAQVNVVALEVCVYVECQVGLEMTSVVCPEGTTQQPSPSGRPGCCASNSMGFEIEMSCSDGFDPFGDDSALVYMSVAGSEPGVCQEYTLTYHF